MAQAVVLSLRGGKGQLLYDMQDGSLVTEHQAKPRGQSLTAQHLPASLLRQQDWDLSSRTTAARVPLGSLSTPWLLWDSRLPGQTIRTHL
jgi:hypothetical protein